MNKEDFMKSLKYLALLLIIVPFIFSCSENTTETNTVATPTFSVAGGDYMTTQVVSIACATADATIRYTTNGTEPDSLSTLYVGPITVATDVTLKAKGFKAGWNPSSTATVTYLILFNEMVSVPGGSFTMGRTLGGTGYNDELPTHTVTLSPFYISKFEVKQAEWIAVMGSNPSNFTGDLNRPVEKVSWYATLVYCNKRSIAEGLTPAYTINGSTNPTAWGTIPATNNATWNNVVCELGANGYRLPTEAEWEFAARGGVSTPDYLYSGGDTVGNVAWYQTNSGSTSHTVGQKIANALGLYDMSGNVQEWVWDWYGLYNSSSAINPTGPISNADNRKVIRGGSWNSKGVYTPGSTDVRLVFRNYGTPDDTEGAKGEAKVYNERLGFRVVRSSM